VLRICIALKIHHLGSKPRPLGPVANTLTTTPLRRLNYVIIVFLFQPVEASVDRKFLTVTVLGRMKLEDRK
jgi:hypothetical protein